MPYCPESNQEKYVWIQVNESTKISMAWRKAAVTPLLIHLSYCNLALGHQYDYIPTTKPCTYFMGPTALCISIHSVPAIVYVWYIFMYMYSCSAVHIGINSSHPFGFISTFIQCYNIVQSCVTIVTQQKFFYVYFVKKYIYSEMWIHIFVVHVKQILTPGCWCCLFSG